MCQVYDVLVGGSNAYYYWTQFLEGDTTINDVLYHKVGMKKTCIRRTYGVNEPQGGPEFFSDFLIQSATIGGIRESGKKVYFRKFELPALFQQNYFETALFSMPANEEGLLYDFNLQVNDTFLLGLSTRKFVVQKIETFNNRQYHTLKNLTGFGYTVQIIEGMGHSGGLLGIYYDPTNIPLIPACMTSGGVPVQASEYCDDCPAVSATRELEATLFRVSPNPAADWICLETNSAMSCNLSLWDLRGRLLHRVNDIGNNHCLQLSEYTADPVVLLALECPGRRSVIKKVIRH